MASNKKKLAGPSKKRYTKQTEHDEPGSADEYLEGKVALVGLYPICA